jgi:integration host factor subunit alpha
MGGKKGERKGRNPATGEDMILKPRKVVTFKFSGTLRNKINEQQGSRNILKLNFKFVL